MRQNKTIMSFAADRDFAEKVERMIKATGSYSSKSEFLRDAARQRLVQMLGVENEVKRLDEALLKIRKKVKFYRPLTPEDKDRLADEYLKSLRQNP